ncbi:MAG: hypothetical protein ACD_5C00016G0016 [uncultured bacterium]|nr:MAG: hypothetical protein ACD_5C00016G0016 [uncultured bacterium]
MADSFEYKGKTYSNNNKKTGMSDREYWSSITGYDKSKYPGSSSSSKVKNLDDAKDFINSKQSSDVASKTVSNEPAIRASVDNYGNIAAGITGVDPSTIKAPDAPNFADTFSDLRAGAGVSELEDEMNTLNAQAEEIAAGFRTTKANEEGKYVMTNVAEGRVSQEERAANERLDAVNRRINTITNQLNTAYKVIDMTMTYKGMDYNAAVATYNTQFSNHIQAINLVKGIDDSIKTEQQREIDNARANLQIVSNNLANSTEGWSGLSKSQKNTIAKLEAQAGLPQGTFANIAVKNPGGEIITTKSWQDGSGKEYVSVVTRQKDGSLKTNNMYVGQGKAPSSDNNNSDTRTQTAIDKVTTAFDSLKGGDGKVSPEVWNDFRKLWTGSTSDFDSRFSSYVNKDRRRDYAGFDNL